MRFVGSLVKRYQGDIDIGKLYVGIARVLLGRFLAVLGGAQTGSRLWNLADGAKITTSVAYGEPSIEIDVRSLSVEEPLFGRGIVCVPIAEEAPNGWGLPINEGNAPLGTPNGERKQVTLLSTLLGKFMPMLKLKRFTEFPDGNIQWVGRTRADRVWFYGPPARCRGSIPAPIYYTADLVQIDVGFNIHGAAIYRQVDGTGVVLATTGPTADDIVFRLRVGMSMTTLGTYTPPNQAFYIDSPVFFNRSGTKAVWTTREGGVIEATVTASGVTFDVIEVPKMLRVTHLQTIESHSIANRERTTPTGPGTFVDNTEATTTELITCTAQWEEIDPVTNAVIDTLTPPFNVPFTADYDGDTRVIGRMRITGYPRYVADPPVQPFVLVEGVLRVNPAGGQHFVSGESYSANSVVHDGELTITETEDPFTQTTAYDITSSRTNSQDATFEYTTFKLELLGKSGTALATIIQDEVTIDFHLSIAVSVTSVGDYGTGGNAIEPDEYGTASITHDVSSGTQAEVAVKAIHFFDLRNSDLILSGFEGSLQFATDTETVSSSPVISLEEGIATFTIPGYSVTRTYTESTSARYEVYVGGVRRRNEVVLLFSESEGDTENYPDESGDVEVRFAGSPVDESLSTDDTETDEESVSSPYYGGIFVTQPVGGMTAKFAARAFFSSSFVMDGFGREGVFRSELFVDNTLINPVNLYGLGGKTDPRFIQIGSF